MYIVDNTHSHKCPEHKTQHRKTPFMYEAGRRAAKINIPKTNQCLFPRTQIQKSHSTPASSKPISSAATAAPPKCYPKRGAFARSNPSRERGSINHSTLRDVVQRNAHNFMRDDVHMWRMCTDLCTEANTSRTLHARCRYYSASATALQQTNRPKHASPPPTFHPSHNLQPQAHAAHTFTSCGRVWNAATVSTHAHIVLHRLSASHPPPKNPQA